MIDVSANLSLLLVASQVRVTDTNEKNILPKIVLTEILEGTYSLTCAPKPSMIQMLKIIEMWIIRRGTFQTLMLAYWECAQSN